MNYIKIYEDLILKAKSENRRKGEGIYYECHHILPRCLNGSNRIKNLVLLTAREHFIAHKLLVEIYPDNKKIIYALRMMYTTSKCVDRKYRIGSREFENIKNTIYSIYKNKKASEETRLKQRLSHIGIKFSEERKSKMRGRLMSEEARKNMRLARQGRIYSQETKDKISLSHIGVKFSEERKSNISKAKLGYKVSEEVRLKISNSHIGVKLSEEHRKNISLGTKGKKRSMETRAKMVEIHKNREILCCPHCDIKSKNHVNMYRFHFDNCKHNPNYTPSKIIVCPYCNFESTSKMSMTRWHFDNCKLNERS